MLSALKKYAGLSAVCAVLGVWQQPSFAGHEFEYLAEIKPLNSKADFVASRLYNIAGQNEHFVYNTVCALEDQSNPLENCMILRFAVDDNAQTDVSFNLRGQSVVQVVYDEQYTVYAVAGGKRDHKVYQLNEAQSRWDLLGNLPSDMDVHRLIAAYNALYIQGEQGKSPVVMVYENANWVPVIDTGTNQMLNVGQLFMWKSNMWAYHPDGQLRNVDVKNRDTLSRIPVIAPADKHQWRWIHGHKRYYFQDTNPFASNFYHLHVHFPRSGSSCWMCSHDIYGSLYGINMETGAKIPTIHDLRLQPKGSEVGAQGIAGQWDGWLTNNTIPFFRVGYVADSQYDEGWTWTHGAVRYDDISGPKPKWAWAPIPPDNDFNAALDSIMIDGSGTWLYIAGFDYIGGDNTTDHPKARLWRMKLD